MLTLAEGRPDAAVRALAKGREAYQGFRRLGAKVGAERQPRLLDDYEEYCRKALAALEPPEEAGQDPVGALMRVARSLARPRAVDPMRAIDALDAIVSAEDVTAGKPDPQVFLKAANRLHVPPSLSIVVEDVAAGVEAARRAGMRSIGVSRTETLNADLYVRSLLDLDSDAFERLLADAP